MKGIPKGPNFNPMQAMMNAQQQLAQTNPEMASTLAQFGLKGKEKPRRKTTEEKEYLTAKENLDKMKKEAAQYENPDAFAKYGKMQRQMLKIEKELDKLKVKADQSQSKPLEEGEEEIVIEEAKNVEEVKSTSQELNT